MMSVQKNCETNFLFIEKAKAEVVKECELEGKEPEVMIEEPPDVTAVKKSFCMFVNL